MDIRLEKPNEMLNVTTKKGFRTAVRPIHRCYLVDHLKLHCNRWGEKWFIYWMPAKTKSITQCAGVWVYMNRSFAQVYSKETNQRIPASETLQELWGDIVTLQHMKIDIAPEICGRDTAFLELSKNR